MVQDNFKFGDDKEIVRAHGYASAACVCVELMLCLAFVFLFQIVALQNDVLAINKKNLKRPTRASLAPGPSRSRSSIVNTPY